MEVLSLRQYILSSKAKLRKWKSDRGGARSSWFYVDALFIWVWWL